MSQLALFTRDDTTRVITMEELQELWAELKARSELWNGMTHHYLSERYGDRLQRAPGGGWQVAPRKVS